MFRLSLGLAIAVAITSDSRCRWDRRAMHGGQYQLFIERNVNTNRLIANTLIQLEALNVFSHFAKKQTKKHSI